MAGVWIPVLASMKGFVAEVNRGADTAAKQAGQKLQKGLSDATKDAGAASAQKMAKAIEDQTTKIATARKAQVQAAADVRVAEQKLENLRASGTAKASQIAKAEGQLETAKLKHKNATAQLQRGERDLESVRQGGQATATALARAEDQLANAKAQALAKQGQLRTAEAQATEAREKATVAAKTVSEAELNLINVRDRYGANTKETATAEKQLEAAKRQAATADNQVAAAAGRVTKARVEVVNATDNVRAKAMSHKAAQLDVARAEQKAGDSAQAAGKKMMFMGREMATANTPARNLTTGLMGMSAKAASFAGVAAGGLGLVGVTNFMGTAITAGMEFDKVLGSLSAVSGATAEQMDAIRARARELGQDTDLAGTSAASAADAMLALAKGGMDVQQSMDAAKGSIQLAGAAQIDAGQAAEIQIAALNSFGLAASDASRVADVLTNTANNSATGVTDLAEALKMAAPTASTLGVSLEDTNTMIGLFANNGIQGTMAGTAMRSALLSMTSPSKQAAAALEEMGINAFDAEGKFVGLRDVAEQLKGAQERMGDSAFTAAASVAFGREAVGFATTAAKGGAAAFDDLRGKMDKTGSAGETAGAALSGMNGALDRVGNSLSDVKQRLYDAFAPTLTSLIDVAAKGFGLVANGIGFVTENFGKFKPLATSAKGLLVGLGIAVTGLVAVNIGHWLWGATAGVRAFNGALIKASVGHFASAVKKAAGAMRLLNISMLANPMVAVAAAIAAVVAGLVLFFTKTETGRKMWGSFTGFLKDAWDATVQAIKGAFDAYVKPVWDGLVDGAKRAWDGIQKAFGWIKEAVQGTFDLLFKHDYTGAFGRAFNVEEDAPIVDKLLRINEAFRGLWDLLVHGKFSENLANAFHIDADNGFVTTILGIRDAVIGAFEWIKQKIVEIGPAIGQFKTTWLDPLGAFISWWVNTLIIPVMKLLGDVIGFVIGTVIVPLLMFFGSVLKSVWEAIVKPVWDGFKATVELVASIIGVAINTLIIPAFQFLGSMISSVWQNIILPVWNFMKSAVGLLADFLTGNFSNIGNRFRELGKSIMDIIMGPIKVALDFFKGLVGLLGDAWDGFKQVVGLVVEFVIDRIKVMMSNIMDIPGKVKNVFSNAGQWLVSAGQRIINGLWEGMKNAWSNVKNWLSDHLSFSSIGSLVGLRFGGVVESNATGGITEAYVHGGIRQLEAYANGGGRENHVAQIAPAGAWRVWAEPETGGEAYIPLASSKRERSTAILNEVAGRFGFMLIDDQGRPYAGGYRGDLGPQNVAAFANGAVVGGDDLVRFVQGEGASRPLEGAPYVFGGSNWGDCSGTQSAVAAKAVGLNPFPRKFSTANEGSWLSAHGFMRGRGGDGDLRIGFMNGGPGGGHTAGTMPNGVNFEMGGGRGNGQYGGPAAGAWDSYFTDFYYLPMAPSFEKVDVGDLGELSPAGIPDTPGDAAAASLGTDTTGLGAGDGASTGTSENTISGMAGSIAKEVVSGHVKDVLGVFGVPDTLPSWLTGARDLAKEYKKTHSGNARSSLAEDHAAALHDDAVTSMTPAEMRADPQLRNADSFDVVEQPQVPEWGPKFFAYEIARQAKAMGLGADGAKIGLATALVESGDPLKMFANNAVPESLKYRHDEVGSDHDSVGLFQQRNNGAWGTVAERMDPFKSAGMFFRELQKFDWKSMEPGQAAQKVQRSAFPDRYATKMGRAEQLLNEVGLFDQGGVLKDKSLALNLSGKPEAVLTNDQWGMLNDLGGNLPSLVGGLTSSAVGTAGMAGIAGVDAVVPGAGAALEPLVGVAADYAGGVTSGWTQAVVTAANQTADLVMEPVNDTVGEFAQPVIDMANQVQSGVREVADRAQSTVQQVQAKTPININVQNMEQAYDAKRRLEARELAGFM